MWCIKCKGEEHDKDHCPVFANYLAGGANSIEIRHTSRAKYDTRASVRDLSGGRKAHNGELSSVAEVYADLSTIVL